VAAFLTSVFLFFSFLLTLSYKSLCFSLFLFSFFLSSRFIPLPCTDRFNLLTLPTLFVFHLHSGVTDYVVRKKKNRIKR
jgi:hypothetical protein